MKSVFTMALILLSSTAYAQQRSYLMNNDPYSVVAPTIFGTPSNPVVGQIYYDVDAGGFKGINQTGTVDSLSPGINSPPTIQKITAAGSGTYTTPTNPSPLYIRVVMVGGGGGGAGGGTVGTPGAGGSGGNSTFGSSLLAANGGSGGTAGVGGTGGTASLGSGPIGSSFQGSSGGATVYNITGTTFQSPGGAGGSTPMGGAGQGSPGTTPLASIANTGSGGAGGGTAAISGAIGGAGGGASGYVDAIITNPSATYSYTLGAGGAGGTAGTSGSSGGAGASGYIIVYEYYQ